METEAAKVIVTGGAVALGVLLLIALLAASMLSSQISRKEEKWHENK